MHNSVAATLKRKTTRRAILIAALLITSHVGAIAAQSSGKPSKSAQPQDVTITLKTADSDRCAPSQPGASSECHSPCATCCPGANAACISQNTQIALAQIEAQRAAAKDAAENTTLQTQAQIEAAQEAAKNAADKDESQGKAAEEAAKAASKVFWWVFASTGSLLLLLLLAVGAGLVWGKWSLREALSEKPSVRSREAAAPPLPSTSRFIALIGLLGILTILLGVVYAIIWNLLLYHKPPDSLSEINSFMLGAASLFAPYIANQLRAAFGAPSDKKFPEAEGQATITATPATAAPATPAPATPAKN